MLSNSARLLPLSPMTQMWLLDPKRKSAVSATGWMLLPMGSAWLVTAPVTVQNSCSLVARSAEREVAEALYREGMSLLAFSPLAGGYLTGKYLQGAKPNGRYVLFDTAGMMFRKPMVPEAVAAFDEVARRLGMPLVDLAFGYVRSRWYVGATIIGATTMDQLREDLRAAQVTLDQAALDEIAQVHVRFPNPAP